MRKLGVRRKRELTTSSGERGEAEVESGEVGNLEAVEWGVVDLDVGVVIKSPFVDVSLSRPIGQGA